MNKKAIQADTNIGSEQESNTGSTNTGNKKADTNIGSEQQESRYQHTVTRKQYRQYQQGSEQESNTGSKQESNTGRYQHKQESNTGSQTETTQKCALLHYSPHTTHGKHVTTI